MTMTLVFVFAVVLMFAVWRAPPLRARRIRRRTWRGWCRRQYQRRMRLWSAGVPPNELLELSQIVEHASGADRSDLESLLDRYVGLAVARQRCLAAMYQTNADRLAIRAEMVAVRAPRLAHILQRRIAQSHDIAANAATLQDRLGALGELIRYYAERAMVPDGDIRSTELIADAVTQLDADREVELELAPAN